MSATHKFGSVLGRFGVKSIHLPFESAKSLPVPEDRRGPPGVAQKTPRINLRLKPLAPSHALWRRVHADRVMRDPFVIDCVHEPEGEPARRAAAGLGNGGRSVRLLDAIRTEAAQKGGQTEELSRESAVTRWNRVEDIRTRPPPGRFVEEASRDRVEAQLRRRSAP